MSGEKYWDISDILISIKKFPQTYKSILGDDYNDGTAQLMVRTKLNKLVKSGELCKTSIPGTRFGKCLFYAIDKNYYMLVEAGRTGSSVYCFFKYKKLNRFFISVEECWMLVDDNWVKSFNKVFLSGKVLMLL